jgi:hypothetical protein
VIRPERTASLRANGEARTVPSEAKQAGEIRSRWGWVEPSAWTDRMLATLERGVKGGKKRLLCRARALLSPESPCPGLPVLSQVRPPTGEPYAGEPHVRFGGRGSRDNRPSLPLSSVGPPSVYSRRRRSRLHHGRERAGGTPALPASALPASTPGGGAPNCTTAAKEQAGRLRSCVREGAPSERCKSSPGIRSPACSRS